MKIEIEQNGKGTYKISINSPLPPVDFQFKGEPSLKKISDFDLSISEDFHFIYIEKPLGVREHIVGLGEKATELDRRRFRYTMYNLDAGPYSKFQDPLYINIPFFISINKGKFVGYFINSASKVIFDIGVEDYSKIKIKIPHKDVEIYVFEGNSIEEILEKYTDLTGKPYLPPEWAFGYMISRYSYYPQDKIIEILDEMSKEGFKVSAVFLDIDFMDSFKLFTWNKERFPDPKKFIDEVHKRGVKIITIVDHSVRADQNYQIFISGLGNYCETDKGELFVGKLWPGFSVYPDFFREDTREWWSNEISKWLSQGIDGIWLDMNEPTDFTKVLEINDIFKDLPIQIKEDRFYMSFPKNVVHLLRGRKVHHELVRNAYPLYEAMATFEGFEKEKRNNEVFILSRSGYAGIQKYATVWTGDNTPSWSDLKLQLQLVLGLSISGVPNVGIDIGAFQGRGFKEIDNSQELLTRYFQLALFFPFFRTHKAPDGIDTEPIYLPSPYKEKVKEVINIRYKFLPYIYSVAEEAHEKGHPIIRPLFYEFPDDENTYRIEDEYMLGKHLLYAPIITPSTEKRKVYLPKGRWLDYWSKEIVGGIINSVNDLPIYIRENSVIPLSDGDLLVFGNGKITYKGTLIESNNGKITFSKQYFVRNLIYIGDYERIIADGEEKGNEINKEVKIIEIK
ncbi:glycoside hydrolase family 31 protein [Acidianus sulfidivorans JP7]|uniref:Alpha-glucosidase n=1 Tax=Acidianus sulfidivorans JP7 TaxID=619593 RepID=A0A2U9ILH2_9CREN|nr:alpha-glucosidase MalA [Acidianus sulfidivorans]AWR96872.1 glycoside hydrolase family 31 protein [Acidianus sulfidivorans JP7]